MKIVFIKWGPGSPNYFVIVAEDKALRFKGQFGSFNTAKDVLAPDWYGAFWDLPIETRKAIERQADEVVAEHATLRAIADRLTS
jgi:hypothetical protein